MRPACAPLIALVLVACQPTLPSAPTTRVERPAPTATFTASDGRFRDGSHRVVILRGVNLSGDAKLSGYPRNPDVSELPALGANVIRLLFIWDAYEHDGPGAYVDAYADKLAAIARDAWTRGIRTIIDFHQDAFSRQAAWGCGDGFPAWAMAKNAHRDTASNGEACRYWFINAFLAPNVRNSYRAFFKDSDGQRRRYLEMVRRVARRFATVDGVIGYDLMNEPWADEPCELWPLYRDIAAVIREEHPTAVLFVEPDAYAVNSGWSGTRLPRPEFDNFAYSPHFYDGGMMLFHVWSGVPATINRAFSDMEAVATEWNAPVFVGEFGAPAGVVGVDGYVAAIYARLDRSSLSGAQWNYTRGWKPDAKDGWNVEDFSIVDDHDRLRPNFRVRPYPQLIAGEPRSIVTCQPDCSRLTFEWDNQPELGETEFFFPSHGGHDCVDATADAALRCHRPDALHVACRSPKAGRIRVEIAER